jgi:2-C-methyl-D-erythritol 4-phosphate cytidylyltransferase
MEKKIFAIVPSAGLGRRFGDPRGKTSVLLNGIPLYIHALKRLNSDSAVTEIIPVLKKTEIEKGFNIIKKYDLHKVNHISPGGEERQDSINNALKLLEDVFKDSLEDSYVLIHDGVRPIVPEGTVASLVKHINNADGIIPCIPSKDTLKEVGPDGLVVTTLNREHIRAVQTPQLFPFKMIQKAYDLAYKKGWYATDDAALIEKIGGKVKTIAGSPLNIKVTTPDDLTMVKYLLGRNFER